MSEERFRRTQRKYKIAMIVIPIITITAIVLVVRWALSSPTLETLVTVNIGIGIATFGALFGAITFLSSRIYEAANSVREDIKGMREDIRNIGEEMRRSADRIVEAIKKS